MQAGRLCSRRRNRCKRLDRFCGERRQREKEPTDQAVISVLSLGICCVKKQTENNTSTRKTSTLASLSSLVTLRYVTQMDYVNIGSDVDVIWNGMCIVSSTFVRVEERRYL